MRIFRVGQAGSEQPVVEQSDSCYDLSPLTADIDGAFLASGGIAIARDALEAGRLPRVEVEGRRLGAPIVRPHAIWCIGMNYAAHAAESGAEPPVQPVLFFKTPNTVVGPNDDVTIPLRSTKTDWEVELAVVIGKRACYLDSPADAPGYIAGYTISNDVSERAWQIENSGGQWSKGKCCETFNPLGPALVPSDELSPTNLRLQSWVNGEPRQDSTTADLIFPIDFLVWHLSQVAVLEPGDVINTGTPEGVALSGKFPYLRAGDVMELRIEGIGKQRQVLQDAKSTRAVPGTR